MELIGWKFEHCFWLRLMGGPNDFANQNHLLELLEEPAAHNTGFQGHRIKERNQAGNVDSVRYLSEPESAPAKSVGVLFFGLIMINTTTILFPPIFIRIQLGCFRDLALALAFWKDNGRGSIIRASRGC